MIRHLRRMIKKAETAAVTPVVNDLREKQDELDRRVALLEKRKGIYQR